MGGAGGFTFIKIHIIKLNTIVFEILIYIRFQEYNNFIQSHTIIYDCMFVAKIVAKFVSLQNKSEQ